jgi:RimJ/RimL family protein N-acetyltransferase
MRAPGGSDLGAARLHSGPSIARRLPDIPRWVEARSLLLSGDGEIFGLDQSVELSLAVRDPSTGSVVVIGRPAQEAVQAAVRGIMHDGNVVATLEEAGWLAATLRGWRRTRAILYLLRDSARLPEDSRQVRFLDPGTIDRLAIPKQLRRELAIGAERSPIAATLVDGQPVSFCYAGSVTESLWDVSIDTLAAHRRRGYAALCAAHMIRHMAAQGKEPVWGAVEENPASWRLAEKIGFVPADEIALFEPPWATAE